VERGTFRQDLFYRLNVIKITTPPLRERKEDIPMLLDRFLSRHGHYIVSGEIMDALMRYDWPGNVRELQNCADRMAAMNPGPQLQMEDLPSALQYEKANPASADLATLQAATERMPIIPLQELEKRAIKEAIEQTNGDRSVAAVMLGIGRTTLYRKLKAYNLLVESRCYVQPGT
jgi:DNA-binding NtrC family response regulator